MLLADQVAVSFGALREHRLRTALSMLGIAIGVGAVILLTSIGEGTRRYILGEFTQFGTHVMQINPGKTETFGIPGALGGTTRKLTLEDALSLERVRGVERVIPVVMGQARVEGAGRGRSVFVFGTTPGASEVWRMPVGQGRFLPQGDPRRSTPVAVLGSKLKRELFGATNALGEFVRIAGTRLRVIGVMQPKGQLLGFDMDDVAFVPVALGMRAFNMEELVEIDVTFSPSRGEAAVVADVRAHLTERHDGHEDYTLLTQADMLETFDGIMRTITAAVGAIAGISLVVGMIGILTTMWISVGERTAEIGLLRALGATRRNVLGLFLLEAALLAGLGGAIGLGSGLGLARLLRLAVPGLPVHTPVFWALVALLVSAATGLAAGVAPARRAARLDPIEALRAE